MFAKEKTIIEEKLDKKLKQKESVSTEIQRQKNLYNVAYSVIDEYNSSQSAKRSIRKLIKFLFFWCGGVFFACFILPHDLFFPMEETEELMNFLYFTVAPSLGASCFGIHNLRIIIRNKDIKEDDYNKSIQEAEESEREITLLKRKANSLENEIKECEDALNSIWDVHKNINNILSVSGNQPLFICTDEFIKEKLLDDFEKYLSEPVDYSKVSLTPETENFVMKLSRKK